MPVYQYRDQRGQLVELVRPIAERDQVPAGLTRVTVPANLCVVPTGGRPNPTEADQAVPRAFRRLEDKMSASEILREAPHMTASDVREAWDFKQSLSDRG